MIVTKFIRYTALSLGFLASAFFAFFLVTEAIADLIDGKFRVVPILVMMIFSVMGFIWAVKNPKKGSFIMISGGLVMIIYLVIMGGLGEIMMSLIFGLPFVIPGLLLRYYDKRRKIETEIV
jgi:hypothetical protein